MRRLPNLGEGQGRDDVAYNFAAFLVRDMAVSDEVALAWLERWDAGNTPPKGRERMLSILASARRYGRNPVASGLGPPSRGILPAGRPGHSLISFTVEVRA
jgi:hypothetical protein